MNKLRSYLKTVVKFLFLYLIWNRIKSMMWEKTKEEVEKKAKKELDPAKPE